MVVFKNLHPNNYFIMKFVDENFFRQSVFASGRNLLETI